ncbi:MAG: heterodisulfide reductase-related iron-sulfur binding cluster, partial [Gammaproteobacteria bacterium]
AKDDYWKVVDHCYLCDLCYMTKCPYVPPHEWNLDFPHLMLRAKAVRFKKHPELIKGRDKLISNTDMVGKLAGIPIINSIANASANVGFVRDTMGIHKDAVLPKYHSNTLSKRLKGHSSANSAQAVEGTTGKVAIFGTCYGEYNDPTLGEDLLAVLEHNGIETKLVSGARCCGMPKLELGDLEAVEDAKNHNVPLLADLVDQGYDIIAPIPSCGLMFRQELPLMYPQDEAVKRVQAAIFDPFEYLMLRHKGGALNTDFKQSLGTVSYHVACHQRVQNIGMKTRDVLSLIPDTQVKPVERCSGHDGTYAVKAEFHEASIKICKPAARKAGDAKPDHVTSDCVMAGHHIAHVMGEGAEAEHPFKLLRRAYGI